MPKMFSFHLTLNLKRVPQIQMSTGMNLKIRPCGRRNMQRRL